MRADKLIALLSEVDGTTEVVIAGAVETVWSLEQALPLDGHIVLVHGARLPDLAGVIRPDDSPRITEEGGNAA